VKRLILVASLGGCGFGVNSTEVPRDGSPVTDGTSMVDGALPIDAKGQPLDAQLCIGRGLIQVCVTVEPTNTLTPTGMIDTSSASNCTVRPFLGGIEQCAIIARNININSTVLAIGSRPLILVATDDISITAAGTLDASSRFGVRKGAGTGLGGCGALKPAEDDSGGGGGGGGGGFGTSGGDGGTGDADDNGAGDDALGGGGGGVVTASGLRGGCSGSKGGAAGGNLGGLGGEGGGGVYLIAGRKLTVDGNVFASGAGGGANNDNSGAEQGGGGGGSGGMIGLDAQMVAVSGFVVANGGAGGGGGGANGGGKPGTDGTTLLFSDRALGGDPGTGNAGRGADGTALNKLDTLTPAEANGGGGGGAGGLGFVRIDGSLSGNGQISPPPSR